jgi:hypothetical protein
MCQERVAWLFDHPVWDLSAGCSPGQTSSGKKCGPTPVPVRLLSAGAIGLKAEGPRAPWVSNHTIYTLLETVRYRTKYRSRHQTTYFKVTAKSYNVATRTAEPRRVKTAQKSHRIKASNAVLVTIRAVRGVISFRGFESRYLVAATITPWSTVLLEKPIVAQLVNKFLAPVRHKQK